MANEAHKAFTRSLQDTYIRVRTRLESPWKSLNFKIKCQGLKSPWKLQSVLESTWNLFPILSNEASQVWDENRHTLYFEHLMWHHIGLILHLLESLKNGKICPWKALKSTWIFGRKKCTNPVTWSLQTGSLFGLFREMVSSIEWCAIKAMGIGGEKGGFSFAYSYQLRLFPPPFWPHAIREEPVRRLLDALSFASHSTCTVYAGDASFMVFPYTVPKLWKLHREEWWL